MRRWHIQLVYKRYSKRKDQYTLYGRRYKSIVACGVCSQEAQHWNREGGQPSEKL